MKNKMKTLSLFLMIGLFFIPNAQAQKNVDLEFRIQNPQPTYEVLPNDTLFLYSVIKNNGPDNVDSTDTINWVYDKIPQVQSIIHADIPAGDSVSIQTLTFINAPAHDTDVTMRGCYYLKFSSVGLLNDMNPSNDTFCLDVLFKGFLETGISERKTENLISIYPNPTKDIVYLKTLNVPSNEGVDIKLYDLQGRLMQQKLSHQKLTSLDVRELSNGLYYLQVSSQASGQIIGRKKMLISK